MTEKSDPVEVMARAMLGPECPWDGLADDPPGFEEVRHETREKYRAFARSALSAAEAAGMVMVRGIRLYTEPSSEAGQFVIVEASGVEVIRAFGALPDIVIDHYVTPVGISAAMIEAASLAQQEKP